MNGPIRKLIPITLLLLGWSLIACPAQSFTIDWFTIDGGGGVSTGGLFSVSGTLGQPDAGTLSGGPFTLVGGFWGVASAVQTPGAPLLSVTRSNSMVHVSWPKIDPGWKLLWTTNLVAAGSVWTEIPAPYPTNATECVVTEPAPARYKYYRLRRP